jgi:hypothetical protein
MPKKEGGNWERIVWFEKILQIIFYIYSVQFGSFLTELQIFYL